MKKHPLKTLLSLMFALTLLLQTSPILAFADIAPLPGQSYVPHRRPVNPYAYLPYLVVLIAVAVIVICVVIWLVRRKKK